MSKVKKNVLMTYFAISHDTFPAMSHMFDVISCNGNMRRHRNKGAMSISVSMLCDICTFVTGLLPSSFNNLIFIATYHLGHNATKPVFRVSDKMRFKPGCSATDTSKDSGILPVASTYMTLSKK